MARSGRLGHCNAPNMFQIHFLWDANRLVESIYLRVRIYPSSKRPL